MQRFLERLTQRVQERGPLCVGLDPHLSRMSPHVQAQCTDLSTSQGRRRAAEAIHGWSIVALEAVQDHAAIIKPQIALYEQFGAAGLEALEDIVARAKKSGTLVLMDAKRGDIGSTAEAYARAILDNDGPFGADAVTLSPYLGRDSMAPFIQRCGEGEKGVFILLRTSNPGGSELQRDHANVAELVARWVEAWNLPLLDECGYGPVGVVVGATLGDELAAWRRRLPSAWFLMPGFGAQGASAVDCRAGFRSEGLGALINTSRGVLFPSAGEEELYAEEPGAVILQKTLAAKTELLQALQQH
ncbi:MAG: orotidine-5'-phosphate decarboxylase [Myxococcota bacterium]|nr:orotidine-5'-phosphate decarboxylase [Myxococcota bacterium]